jgi:3-oxoadipate enol-lactonase/4-carboxymuconolactone decarboxylase
MPFIHTPAATLYYRLDGADDKPVVVLSHSLGLDHGMWDRQAADLLPHFRVLRVDTRGHGASSDPAGDYSVETLGRDVLAIVDAIGIDRFAFVGLSLGGMIGQWLALNVAPRLTHLVLANTTARVSQPAAMEERRRTVLASGMAAVVDAVMARCLSPETIASHTAEAAWARRTLLATAPAGYAGCCAAIRDMDHRDALARISTPTLVIAGERDVSMPPAEHSDILSARIPGAFTVRLRAAHVSNLEQPRTFSAALLKFLVPGTSDVLAAGMGTRRAGLGDAHVDRSIASMTDFNRDFQELITRFAWGTIWTRPGLDHRTRRLLVLAITASMGRWEEFRLHLQRGLDHELEWPDVEEVLMQTAVYAGVPAANTGFHIAGEEKKARDG